ncbi:hypothetical protein [Paenibacillus etheri]|uniref:Uncharacterized protein n=1 Tax=Paenibacillus etheri TaxID=1306852 RepID=A0A0W1AZ44_9BACL|nr:hypothetical protein [Paenibacillus etheri]KTD86600.1 hypothetical protein UQ64_14155 [Paenibacillus etheri]
MSKRNRKRNILLSILAGIVGICLVSILLNKTYRTTFESLPETDRLMLTELSKLYNNFEQSSDQLWNEDYRFDTKPLLLVRTTKDSGLIRSEGFAVNVPMQEGIFAEEIKMPESMGLPKVYRISRFSPTTLSAWFPANFGTLNLKGIETMYFKYYPKMFSDPTLYFNFSTFLLHEGFHIFKQKDWTYDTNGAEHIDNYPVNEENYALMGIEFKLLDQAMAENNPQRIQQYLRDWTVVRNYRYYKWPQLIGETKAEAIEGSARYLEYRYSKLTGGNLMVLATKQEPYHVTFMQAYDFIANGQAESPSFLERSVRYETGAALELTMDKANLPWKEAIEDVPGKKPGITPYEILSNYFKMNDLTTIESQLGEIKEVYDYDALRKQGAKIVKQVNIE